MSVFAETKEEKDRTAKAAKEVNQHWDPRMRMDSRVMPAYYERSRGIFDQEVPQAEGFYADQLAGRGSLAAAQQRANLGRAMDQQRMAAAMGPLAARQGMYGSADQAHNMIGQHAYARQGEDSAAKAAMADAAMRRMANELAIQRMQATLKAAGMRASRGADVAALASAQKAQQAQQDLYRGLASMGSAGVDGVGQWIGAATPEAAPGGGTPWTDYGELND